MEGTWPPSALRPKAATEVTIGLDGMVRARVRGATRTAAQAGAVSELTVRRRRGPHPPVGTTKNPRVHDLGVSAGAGD